MKINIFRIQADKYELLLKKFDEIKLVNKSSITVNDWNCSFYLSENPEILEIPWVKDYKDILSDEIIQNKIYFAVYLCKKDGNIFAITYGKSHFYVRNFCEFEFGLNMATRIGNENDVKQVASKRFAGKKKKEIKSFTSNTKLDNESGESVDYISSSIIESKQQDFGKNSKFGNSLIISRQDLKVDLIPHLLDQIITTLEEEQKFILPKTDEIKNKDDILRYDQELLSKIILQTNEEITTINDSHDLIGVDFVFSGSDKYCYTFRKKISEQFDELTLDDLRKFINSNIINKDSIFNIKVQIENENQNIYTKKLKEYIEYTIDNENIVLQNGKWIKFNEKYVNQINEFVDSIEIEPTEDEFKVITKTETDFYKEKKTDLHSLNYRVSDKDFSQLKIDGNYKVEAWDLVKDDTVYAVKFGTAQKLVYVCNQAVATLDIIRNKANLKKLSNQPKKYCLWFGFERKAPDKISNVNSIILKQQIDHFARKCRDIGIEPVLKFSQKI